MLIHPGFLSMRGVTDTAAVSEKSKVAAGRAKVKFPDPPPAGEVLVRLEGASVAYRGGGVMLDGVNLSIEAGNRIIIRGANGAGKSTLLKALVGEDEGGGEVEVRDGVRKVSPGVKMNVFNQDAAQDLDPDVTAVESVAKIVREYDISISDTVIRSVLGQLGLR